MHGTPIALVCLSCAAYTCGKVYALAVACKPRLAAKADRKRVLARVKAGTHPGNNRKGWRLPPPILRNHCFQIPREKYILSD